MHYVFELYKLWIIYLKNVQEYCNGCFMIWKKIQFHAYLNVILNVDV